MFEGQHSSSEGAGPDAACPFLTASRPAVLPADRLVLPMARSAWIERGAGADGAPRMTLWHGAHEIEFDDPHRFAFAEGLVGRAAFAAQDAAGWSGLGWAETAELLADLLEAGVLVRADMATPTERHDNRPMPDPLPPAPLAEAQAWTDPASLMQRLTGTALDHYWLETVVPVFRVAHCFMDADGRQVGEANTFPPAARLAVPTDWRGCPYPGNRYQAEKPMNASALKAMRGHWRQVLALLARMRSAYLARCPDARDGWTVGHVERLSCAVLALPSLLLLRQDGARVANGALHPALSSLFRVTDGLRLVMHQMLFVPVHEAMRSPADPVNAAMILAYADRNFAFHSAHGVCAGPRFMVEDMLGVILDGRAPQGGMAQALEPVLEDALQHADAALDYAFCGLECFGTVFSLWPMMTGTYARIHALLAGADARHGPVADLAARFAGHFAALSERSYLADESWRQHRAAVYDDMVARCHLGRTGQLPALKLSDELAFPATPPPSRAGDRRRPPRAMADAIAGAVAAAFGPGRRLLAGRVAGEIAAFLAFGQRVVARAERVQAETARLLGRAAPAHRLTLDHLDLHNTLMGADVRSLPFLPREIGSLFGLSINVDADTIDVRTIREAAPPAPAPHSRGTMPFGSRNIAQTLEEGLPS